LTKGERLAAQTKLRDGYPVALAISRDGAQFVAIASNKGYVGVWEPGTGKTFQVAAEAPASVHDLYFPSDFGTRLFVAVGSANCVVNTRPILLRVAKAVFENKTNPARDGGKNK
jgi:hypothetical protein